MVGAHLDLMALNESFKFLYGLYNAEKLLFSDGVLPLGTVKPSTDKGYWPVFYTIIAPNL